MKKVYLVSGETGEYDDYHEWSVKVFSDKKEAKKFVNKLHRILKKYNAFAEDVDGRGMCATYSDKDVKSLLNSDMVILDPYFSLDYTGTEYSISELELVENEK